MSSESLEINIELPEEKVPQMDPNLYKTPLSLSFAIKLELQEFKGLEEQIFK